MKRVLLVLGLFVCIGTIAQSLEPNIQSLINSIDHYVFKDGTYRISKNFTDKHNGVSHAYGFQTYQGLEVEGTHFNVHSKNGAIVAKHYNFVSKAELSKAATHSIEKNKVLAIFLNNYPEQFASGISTTAQWKDLGHNNFEIIDPALSNEAIKIKKTYAKTADGVVPSWSMSFAFNDGSHWYYTVFNAVTGAEIEKYDWVINCNVAHDHSSHNFGAASPVAGNGNPAPANKKADGSSYNVFAHPVESPNHGKRTKVTEPADATASPYGWHDTDGSTGAEHTITRGNNVYASEDRDANNQPGYSPNGGSNLEFDYTFAAKGDWNENQDAAITNLFYWVNKMHDVWYHYGFNEESGNFQENNYGNALDGEGDPVLADAQDGSGTNNANMATPPDGESPRMQMFMWGDANGGPEFEVMSPSTNAGKQTMAMSIFGGTVDANGVKGKLVLVIDDDGTTEDGCDNITNGSALDGNIALIERGGCNFVIKVKSAQDAGAIAVVVYQSTGQAPFGMGGNDPDITIPSIMITRTLGLALKAELDNNLSFEVAIYDKSLLSLRDSDFDNGIIAHEFTHGISNRLVGGAMNSNCLTNTQQMGEGWSDFFTLVMTHPKGAKANDLRGIGTYASGQATNGGGIRPEPYTTTITNSVYVLDNISTLQIPHGVGALWCAMLWDMYWAMISEYGYDEDIINGTGGNNKCVQLVIDGMKLTPCNPTFVDARDAIILADKLNNNGENEKLIWQAFTRRGLGHDAEAGDPNDRRTVSSGYELPPKYKGFVFVQKTAVDQIDEDKKIRYSIIIENASDKDFTNISVVDTLPSELSISSIDADCSWQISNNIITLTIAELKAGEKLTCGYECGIKTGEYSVVYVEDPAEEDNDLWLPESEIGDVPWVVQTDVKAEGEGAWFASNTGTNGDQTLLLNVGKIGEDALLSFEHYHNLSPFGGGDGGVVEISENGSAWQDAELYFIQNGYNGEITSNTSTIVGRAAFVGNSGEFYTTIVDLSNWANKDILVRFRFAEDRRFGGEGWYVDNVKVMRLKEVTNSIYATNNGNTSSASATTRIIETGDKNSAGINEIAKGHVLIYPNPAKDFTNLELNNGGTNALLIITDLSGRQLQTQTLKNGLNTVNTQQLPAGSYIFTVSSGDSVQRYQFIKN